MKSHFKPLGLLLALQTFVYGVSGQEALSIHSNTEGIRVGIDLGFKHWASSYFVQLDELDPNGLGIGLSAGYGINQNWEINGNFEYHDFALKNEWDRYGLSAAAVGIRYTMGGTLQTFRPFAQVAYKYHFMTIDPVYLDGYPYRYRLKGGLPDLSAGVSYFLKPNMALQFSGGAAFGKFSSFLLDDYGATDRPDVKTFRLGLGFSYFIR